MLGDVRARTWATTIRWATPSTPTDIRLRWSVCVLVHTAELPIV